MELNYVPYQITKNFHSEEFKCKNLEKTKVPSFYHLNMVYIAIQLQKIRDFLKIDLLRINSGYRTKSHNDRVNGSNSSYHLTAQATDLVQFNLTNQNFHSAILDLIKDGFIPDGEVIKYDTFVHYAPKLDPNHLPEKYVTFDKNVYAYTYNKHMNHEKFQNLQKIREKHKIKTN